MNKKYDVNRLSRLIHYYNHLVHEYDIPLGSIQIQLDDGYTGTTYAIDFDYVNDNTFILENDQDGQLLFAVLYKETENHGVIDDYSPTEIAEMIKKTIK